MHTRPTYSWSWIAPTGQVLLPSSCFSLNSQADIFIIELFNLLLKLKIVQLCTFTCMVAERNVKISKLKNEMDSVHLLRETQTSTRCRKEEFASSRFFKTAWIIFCCFYNVFWVPLKRQLVQSVPCLLSVDTLPAVLQV